MKANVLRLSGIVLVLAGCVVAQSPPKHEPVIPNLPASLLSRVSTTQANGDQNPYGVAFVPRNFVAGASLNPGDIIVSNFNNGTNQQGTGTTIIRVTPTGQTSVFFQGSSNPGSLGLTTVLGVLMWTHHEIGVSWYYEMMVSK